jgi:hypothetical protein
MRLLLISILLWPLKCIAQDTLEEQYRPYFTLKTSPKRPLAFYKGNVALLSDIPLGNKCALELGGGYIFNSLMLTDPNYGETFTGPQYRVAFKYYGHQSEQSSSYVSLYFHNDFITNKDVVQVLRQGSQYTEWIDQTKQFNTWGLGLILGKQIRSLGKRKWLLFEPYFGLGLRRNNITTSALPADAEPIEDRGRGFVFIPRRTTADFILGINIGYIFTPPSIQRRK